MRTFLVTGTVFFLMLLLCSCKKKVAKDGWTDTISSGLIRIACDENFKNLMDAEIDAFEAHNDLAFIIPVYSNETDVIRLLTEDSVRLAVTTRELNVKEKQTMEERQMAVRSFLIAFDGIALVANKINNDSIIGLPTLKKILTGEITEWSQINPHSPLGTIRVIFDNNQSGILRYVVDSITRGKSLSENLYAMDNSDELFAKIAELPNAIGIVGFNLVNNEIRGKNSNSQEKIRMMWVGREDVVTLNNSYLPYAGDVKNENYPLWRAVYVLLSDPRSGLSSGFSIFLAHDVGQTVLLKSGLLPAVTDPQNRSVYTTDTYPGETENNINKINTKNGNEQ